MRIVNQYLIYSVRLLVTVGVVHTGALPNSCQSFGNIDYVHIIEQKTIIQRLMFDFNDKIELFRNANYAL